MYIPQRIVEQLPDKVRQVKLPSVWGYGVVPNHDHKHAGDRAVRQAIQYVINRKQTARNVSKASKTPAPIPTGIAPDNVDNWLGDAKNDFETYGVDSTQTNKATKVLNDAGYKKSGGTWKDPEGENVSVPITVPSGWSDWTTATETIVDQLNDFGFDSTSNGAQFGTIQGNLWPNGDFAFISGGWLAGAPRGTYPYFSLYHQMIYNERGFNYNYPAADKSRGGSNADTTVPSRTGSGSMTVNSKKRLGEIAQSTDESEIEEITIEQAWVANQDLPIIPVLEKVTQSFLTGGDKWALPEQGADIQQVTAPGPWLAQKGELQYNGN
jgi:peptide/nickel transport system substrate-binding protein